jgi:hypothetical protein
MLVWIVEGCGGVCGADQHPLHLFGEQRGILGVWQIDTPIWRVEGCYEGV